MRPADRPYLVRLVRDRVKQAMVHDAHKVEFDVFPTEVEFVKALRRKLGEEVVEYLLDPSLGELADVHEVLRGLAKHDLKVMYADVVRVAGEKRQQRGGYDLGVGMYTVPLKTPPPESAW
jgi:predicted house-cleaning noncanonical NTP pyrophosphatase (MazG superfamily)